MTPLAQQCLKELTLPLSKRRLNDRADLLQNMSDIHCFEVSDALDLIIEMADRFQFGDAAPSDFSTFLPAPKTWIEFGAGPTSEIDRHYIREGFLLQSIAGHDDRVLVTMAAYSHTGGIFAAHRCGEMILGEKGQPYFKVERLVFGQESTTIYTAYLILAALTAINSPRIIGRRQHMPHRGLERNLVRAMGLQGKFPLNAWTEILLRVTPPDDMSDEAEHEAHLTGKKALHFCRAHLRVKMGKIEFVRSHWRGDASVGIKRSRYHLAP